MCRQRRAALAPKAGIRRPTLVGYRRVLRPRIVVIMNMPEAGRQRRTARDWVVDALVFLLCLSFTALTFIDSMDRQPDLVQSNVEAAFGVVASFGVWYRRRWPVGFAIGAGLLSIYSVSASAVALVALYTVAMRCRIAVAVLVAAGYGLASVLSLVVRPDLPRLNLAQSLLGVACVAAVLAWGMFAQSRRQLARTRKESAAAEQEARISQARQSERDRIAREMHDVLGHRLSLLSLHAGALELYPEAAPAEIARAAGIIRENAHLALEDLRQVIGMLRTGQADEADYSPQPTIAALSGLIEESQQAGVHVTTALQTADLEAVPDAAGRTAYRIVQEGLTNARKHAPGSDVEVSVHAAAGAGITIEIRNPLRVDSATNTGMGLIGLKERAGLIGGRLEHGPTEAGEFRLWAWLPWPN